VDEPKQLERYLDEQGRLVVYPSKRQMKGLVLRYLGSKFEPNRHYSEPQVNELLREHHTFGDWALLRRDLFESGLLRRTRDGSAYWRAEDVEGSQDIS
jgi:hypothetical protein